MTGEWDGLAPQHRRYLETRAVTPGVAHDRGYGSADTKASLADLGFGQNQRRPGLTIPVWPPWPSDEPALHQLRPDAPRRNAEGKALKFEQPAKSKMHLDVHPSMRGRLGDPKTPLLVAEGVVKGDAAVSQLDVCTVAPAGVWTWRGRNDDDGLTALADWEHVALNDRDVIVVFDSDAVLKESVHAAMVRLGALLGRRGATVRYCYLPADSGAKVGLDDWLAARADQPADHLLRQLVGLCQKHPVGVETARPSKPYQPPQRRTLADVDAVFAKHLAQPDYGAIRINLAAVIANRAPGDPVWPLNIAPPSSGKTEILMALAGLPDVTVAGRLTVAALLSGTATKERAADATGGLLQTMGSNGILVCKDFGAILAMDRTARAEVLQALRDIYDGHYDRPVGTDGGRHLIWEGHCGLIAATTEAIDGHHAVIAALGDRYVSIRLRLPDAETQAEQAIADAGDENEMRAELGDAVAGLLGHLDPTLPAVDIGVRRQLARLAALAARCRSVVERDTYASREIVNVPRPEQPARIAKQLAKLYAGLLRIGCDQPEAWDLVTRIGLDSMPDGRRKVLEHLANHDDPATTSTTGVGVGVSLPTTVAKRHLEDLEAHGLIVRTSQGQGKPDLWDMSEWCRQRWPTTQPEKLEDQDTPHTQAQPEKLEDMDTPTTTPPPTSIRDRREQDNFSGLPPNGNSADPETDEDEWTELVIPVAAARRPMAGTAVAGPYEPTGRPG